MAAGSLRETDPMGPFGLFAEDVPEPDRTLRGEPVARAETSGAIATPRPRFAYVEA